MDLVLRVLAIILATAILTGVHYIYQNQYGIWRDRYDQLVSRLGLPRLEAVTFNRNRVRKILLGRLRADQDRSGLHLGQFGRHSSTEENKFQTGPEYLKVKPRIYHTLWATTILHERKFLPRSVTYAVKGVRRLFVRDRLYIYQGHQQPPLISYRHTMGGALILFCVEGISPTVRDILGAMIDEHGGWQNQDGGWAQCDREFTASDLWASAYAIRLLDMASESNELTEHERSLCVSALSRTLTYFNACWQKNGWAYGGATMQENAVLVLIEIAQILAKHDRKLLQIAVEKLMLWRTPLGLLNEQYLSIPNDCSILALYTRMSYALLRANEPQEIWIALYRHALGKLDQSISSADIARLLDLTCSASTDGVFS